MMDKIRCTWCLKDDLYMRYHDEIWGTPEYDSTKLFEYINLEGAQAGLSWYTVLTKIDNYKKAFAHWNIDKILAFDNAKIESLSQDPGIIRNKLKINAVVTNAKAYKVMEKNNEDFSEYLWSFVDGQPIINQWKKLTDVPAETDISRKLSKDLKKRGFKFVGPTIVYAFMQAVGMVDDHTMDCWKRTQ